MSFRHTFITEFLYKYDRQEELKNIEEALKKYAFIVQWEGKDNIGYYHGIIKDLDSYETKIAYQEILEELEKVGVRIKIVFE